MEHKETFSDMMLNLVLNMMGFGILGGLGLVGYQVYWYLRLGEWYPFSVMTGLRYLNVQWALYPTEWIGLYKILDDFPLSLAIALIGFIPFLLVCFGAIAYAHISEK